MGFVDTEIRHLVYEQLLHADLREVVEVGCLDGISFHNAGDINGKYFVQVQKLTS